MTRHRLAIALLALLAMPLTAAAHHSFAAEFDASKPVRLIGVLTKLEWTNPHSYFYLDVASSSGAISHWTCESNGTGTLSRLGWKRSDIKPGQTLVVDGYLAKDRSRFIDVRRIKLPDGRTVYSVSGADGSREGAVPSPASPVPAPHPG